VTAAGCIASAGVVGRARAGAATPLATRVRLGYWGSPCEAATFSAPRGTHFTARKLSAELVGFPSQRALIAALDRGTVDAASVNLAAVLEPLERRADVRVTAGLHAGCLRVLARDAIELNSLRDLKGTTVATDELHGPAMSLLSAIMLRAGIDPRTDVTWNVFNPPDLEAALDAKSVAAVATADPLGYGLLSDNKVQPYLDGTDGSFSCGGDIAPGHHCFLVVNGRLVDERPALAAAIVRAYLDTTADIGRGVGPAAVTESTGPLAADIHQTLGMLSSYTWGASTAISLQELEITAHDFRRAGLLAASTDPQALAQRAFADVLHDG
jgi:NitT/TauT family transport system substrate-binding protein